MYEVVDIDSDDAELMDMSAYIDIDKDELLKKWHLEEFTDRFGDEGWSNPLDWIYLSDEMLRNNIGLRDGHIRTFNRKFSVWIQRYNEARQVIKKTNVNDGILIVKEGDECELKPNYQYEYKKIVIQKNAELSVTAWTPSNQNGGVLLLKCVGSIFMAEGSKITAKGCFGGDKNHKDGYGLGGGVYNKMKPCGGSYATPGSGRSDIFDKNGLLYFLGTKGGKTEYSNPATIDMISAAYSSIYSNVDKENEFGFAGRKCGWWISKSTKNQFVCIMLKQEKIKLTHYALRNGKTEKYTLRSWNLEGSNDGETWDLINEHKDDKSLNKSYDTHVWSVDAKQHYYVFRIIMTGPNADDTNYLCLSGLELYGEAIGTKKNSLLAFDEEKTKTFIPAINEDMFGKYGDKTFSDNKLHLGSGPAYWPDGKTGYGGGAIKIECNELIMDKGSCIDVSGSRIRCGDYNMGGSGGSIWIRVDKNVKYKNDYNHTQINALGGYYDSSGWNGCFGGDGRIRIDYKDKDCELFAKYTKPTPYFGYGNIDDDDTPANID
eukprot:208273_1